MSGASTTRDVERPAAVCGALKLDDRIVCIDFTLSHGKQWTFVSFETREKPRLIISVSNRRQTDRVCSRRCYRYIKRRVRLTYKCQVLARVLHNFVDVTGHGCFGRFQFESLEFSDEIRKKKK